VACSALNLIAVAPELMTEPVPDAHYRCDLPSETVIAIGPGLGGRAELVSLTCSLVAGSKLPMVVDADALNALAQF